jgi:hypothetical protein
MKRRKFLLLATAAGGFALLGGGAAFVMTDHYRGWIRDILHRGLPGYTLEPKGFAQFVDEFFANQRRNTQLRLFAAVDGVMDIEPALPAAKANTIAAEERRILTRFLLGSDFFANYPGRSKEITYSGMPAACINPFAKF